MRQARRLGLPMLLLLALATALLTVGDRRTVAQVTSQEQRLWGIYWTVEPGFTTTLEMKNNLPTTSLTVRLSLYFASGEEYPLTPVQLGPRQTTSIEINTLIYSLPRNVAARAGREGTLEVEYDAPTPSALMGSLSVINTG
jgi:hypothetical protein